MRKQNHTLPLICSASLRHLLGLLMMLLPLGLAAQNSDKWISKGEEAKALKEYPRAVECFSFALRKDSSVRALMALGDCWREMRDYRKAAPLYAAALQKPQAPAEAWFYHGLCLLNQKKYEEARAAFAEYTRRAPQGATAFRDLASFVDRVRKDTSSVRVHRLPINSRASDFGAVMAGTEIWFASARSHPAVLHTSTVDDAPLLDLFSIALKDSVTWGKATPVAGPFNTKFNEGPLCFTPDGNTIYFTRNEFLPGVKPTQKNGLNKLRIYASRKTGDVWSEPVDLPVNLNGFATGHPAWDERQQRLWFTSDRPGGVGGKDLWFARYENGSWATPVNAGSEINTAGDEMFPTVGPDGMLYFSSDRHTGLGGLDLFSALPAGNGWQVMNLGFGLNSEADDFCYVPTGNGRRGFLSSNRGNAASNDDIFEFSLLTPPFECAPQQRNEYCFTFFNTDTLEFDFDTIPIIYEWDFGDGVKARGEVCTHCFKGPGDYQVMLNLIDTTVGYVFLNQVSYPFELRDIEQVFISGPDTVTVGTEAEFSGLKSVVPFCVIEEYWWDAGQGYRKGTESLRMRWSEAGTYTLRLGLVARQDDPLLRLYPCISREVVVMTEDRLRQVNDSLRQQRLIQSRQVPLVADSVRRQFLQSQEDGFDPADPGDDPSFRVQIRQSETPVNINPEDVKGLGPVTETRQNGMYNYTVGDEKSLDQIYPVYRKALDKGFHDALVIAFKEGRILSGNDSTLWLRVPGEKDPVQLRLITGRVTDTKAQPLAARIKWEDMTTGQIIDTVWSDERTGEFMIRLPDGKVYGYFAEMEGYFPSGNHIDLTQPGNTAPKVEISEALQLVPIKQAVDEGISLRLNNIFFDSGSDVLRPESFPELYRLHRLLLDHPEFAILVSGHTDDVGTDEYNLDLSQKRAAAVVRFLVSEGISLNRLSSQGYGEMKPSRPNVNEENRQFNRRVEFQLRRK